MPTTDNRIVQMTFKNEQFERGVKESLRSLEELKKALDLDKSAESLSNLEKIAGSFDISGISKGIDNIASRFTLLGNIGQEIFHRISRTAVDTMQGVINTITAMPQAGLNKYEQKNKAVQMIQSAMPEKSIEEIEAVLAKLNEYTDLTSYDFSAMANSIGKFVSAGIDLDVAEKAMEGIANETASAGGEIAQANIAMYNFSQALASGTVKLQDWHSIENQNLATKEFKEQIIETAYELGTLAKAEDKVGVTAKGNTVTYQNMAQTLQEGWFTSDVLIKVLEKYADRESDVGKKGFEAAKIAITLTQAFDAVKDAISTGWMTSFGYLFGNLEEAGDLFTRISDALIDFTSQISETRNELLKGWHDGGKDGISGYQKVIEGLSNIWAVFKGLVKGVKISFKSVFGVLDSSGLIDASKAFADYTAKIKEFFGVWTEDAPENYSHFPSTVNETITHVGNGVYIIAKALRGVFTIAKAGIGVMSFGLQIVGTLFDTIEPIASGLLSIASAASNVISYIVELTSSALSGKDALGKFSSFLSPIADVFQKVGRFLSNVAKTINFIVDYLRSGVGLDGLRNFFTYNGSPTISKYGLAIVDMLEKLRSVGDKIAPVFNTLKTVLSNAFNTVKEWISGKISAGLDALGTFFANLWAKISEGDYLTKILTGIGTALKVVVGIIGGVGYGLYALVKSLVEGGVALFNFVKNSEFLQSILSRLSAFFSPVKDFFASVWESITSISDKIGDMKSFSEIWQSFLDAMKNNPIGQKFAPALEKIGKAIETARNKIKGFFDAIKDTFKLLKTYKDPEKALKILGWSGKSHLKEGVVKILGFLVKVKKVLGNIAPFLMKIKNTVKAFAGSIKTAIGNFFGGDGKSPGEKIGEGVESFKKRIESAFGNLGSWIRDLVGNNPFLGKLAEFGQKIGDAVSRFFSMDTSGLKSLPEKVMARLQAFDPVIDWIKGKFASIKEFLMDPKKLLSHVVGALKGIGEFIIGVFKNVNLGTIWNTAKAALGTYIMLSFAKSLKTLSTSVGILTGAVNKDEKEGLGDKLRHIAVTIAIVTAALAGLALIDAGQALAGVGVMAAALTVIVGAIVAMNKWAPKTEGIGQGILDMALSIIVMIAAIAAAALLINNSGDLSKPLLLVGGIMVALGVVAVLMSKFSKKYSGATQGTAKTILAICAGVYLVVKAISKMTGLLKKYEKNADIIDSAITYIAGMLAILGTVAVLMSALGKKTGSEGGSTGIAPAILAMCTGLGSIVNAVAKMADVMKRYPDHFGGAYAMIEGILFTIGAIAVLLAAFSKDLDWKVSLASAVPIVAMGFFLDTIIQSLGEAIQKISGVNPKIIEQFLIGVGEAVVAMVGTVAVFSQIGLTGLLEAAAGIVAIMAAIGVGVDVMATFAADAVEKLATAMWLVGSRLADFSDFTSKVDSAKIQSAIDVLTNTVVPAMSNMVLNSSVISEAVGVAGNVWLFGEALGLFERSIRNITVDTGTAIKKLPEDIKATVDGINAIQGIDDAKEVLTNLGGALALYYGDLEKMTGETVTDENGNFDINKANEAFGNLAELTLDEDTIKKIQSYATGGENDLNNFAIGIENLGTALKQYGEDINGIDSGKVKTANEIMDQVMEVEDHLKPVAEDFNFDALKGKRTSITDFGLDIAALGSSLAKYGESVASLNPGRIIMGNIVMKTVAKLNKILPETGGLWQMLKGEKSLGDFAANMSSLGDGMANYANKISAANFTNVEASMAPVKALAEAQSILQNNGGISELITGTANLGQLGDGLVGLGEDLYNFATASNGIKDLKDGDFTKIGQAIEPIKKLAEAQSILQNEGGWADFLTGSSNLGNLGQGLENFASHLNSFKSSINEFDFNDEKFVSAMDLLERTVSLQEIVQKGDDEYDFANAGRNMSLLFATIANEITTNTQISDAVTTAAASIKTIVSENAIDQASTWGLDFVTNLANGITNNAELVQQAVEVVTGIISSYLHFSLPEKGDLSTMDKWMPDMMQNLANGITDNSPLVEQAVNMLSGKMSDSFKNLLGIDEDMEDPVISPVLDLTNVEAGASEIPGILNGQSVSASANMAKNIMSGNGVSIIQGGVAEDHSPEIIAAIQDLGNRIVNLETQMATHMSNLKVVMNTNALVGQIAPTMDRVLGGYSNRR